MAKDKDKTVLRPNKGDDLTVVRTINVLGFTLLICKKNRY